MFAEFCLVCRLKGHYFRTWERCLAAGFYTEASSVLIKAANFTFYIKKDPKLLNAMCFPRNTLYTASL